MYVINNIADRCGRDPCGETKPDVSGVKTGVVVVEDAMEHTVAPQKNHTLNRISGY